MDCLRSVPATELLARCNERREMLLSFQHGPCAVGDCDAVTKLGFLGDNRRLFTVCGSLRLWTIVDSLKVCEVAGSGWGSDVNAVAFDKHNSLMAIAEFGSPNVTLIDESGTPPFHQLISLGSPSLREVLSLAFVDTGNMLLRRTARKNRCDCCVKVGRRLVR